MTARDDLERILCMPEDALLLDAYRDDILRENRRRSVNNMSTVELWLAFLKKTNLQDVRGVESFIDSLLDQHAAELADEIRKETEWLRDVGVLEPDKFRPCRDAADQIDPRVPTTFP